MRRSAAGRCASTAGVVALLVTVPFVPARAQCPDGTPPPCGRRAPGARTAATLPPAAERGRRFLVLPFRNVSRAPEHEWLVEGATAMLGESLGRWQELTVVSDDRLYPALRRHGLTVGSVIDPTRVRRLAEETGGWTAVTGEIVATGGRVRVSARAYDVVSNRDVVRATADAAADGDVRAAFENIAIRLLRAAGLDAAATDLAATTTRSLDAYRAYLRGMHHINRAQFRQARTEFLEAVRLDSTFAQAHFMLVEAALFADPFGAFSARGVLQRSLARSVALADHFAPADRDVMLGVAAIFDGRLAAARDVLTPLVARDSNDIRAVAWLGFLEYVDVILVSAPGGERPRGSMNENLRLARRVLALDAARHDVFLPILAQYLLAAGAFPIIRPGVRREAAGLEQLLMSFPARIYVPVMRDTIALVPAESLTTIPADSLAAARRRALDSAYAVSNRWLAAGPSEGIAHHLAAEVAVRAGDLEGALTHLRHADSLGTEFGGLDARLIRLTTLARLGRYEEARRRAETDDVWSRLRADLGVAAWLEEGEANGFGFNLYLMWGEYERAGEMLDARTDLIGARLPNRTMAEGIALQMLAGERVPPLWLVELPLTFRMDVLDSVWTRTPAGTGGPRLESVRATLAQLASRAATAPGAVPALAERARKATWFVP